MSTRHSSPAPTLPPDLPAPLAALVHRGARLVHPTPLGLGDRTPASARGGASTADDPEPLCRAALAAPVGAPRLSSLIDRASRVVVIVSDATRDEPREAMFLALRAELSAVPDAQISLLIASGTHAPRPPETVLPPWLLARHRVEVHDGHDPAASVDLGQTPEGTRVRVNRALCEADIVISAGRIRPHYFAGYSGGAKGIFPGCALAIDARQNHLLKADASARLGRLDDNRCRLDMEAASRLLPARAYLLNVVADCDGRHLGAFAGDLVAAHRAACAAAAPLFVARGERSRVVVASDLPPVTSSLYQASKLLPPAGALLEPGGEAIILAACEEGTGPLQVVNDGIYRLGIQHHLPEGHVVRLVSSLPEHTVALTYARYATDLADALRAAGCPDSGPLTSLTVLWRAGELIVAT
jgi:lactate racemase